MILRGTKIKANTSPSVYSVHVYQRTSNAFTIDKRSAAKKEQDQAAYTGCLVIHASQTLAADLYIGNLLLLIQYLSSNPA